MCRHVVSEEVLTSLKVKLQGIVKGFGRFTMQLCQSSAIFVTTFFCSQRYYLLVIYIRIYVEVLKWFVVTTLCMMVFVSTLAPYIV